MTCVAPIYSSDSTQIIGAVILKKIIENASDLAIRITETTGLHAALYEDVRMISKADPHVKTIGFISTPKPVLESVYRQNKIVTSTSFYRGGRLSIHSPILDFNGSPVGILMLQSGVQPFMRGRDTIITSLMIILSGGVFLLYMLEAFWSGRWSTRFICSKPAPRRLEKVATKVISKLIPIMKLES